MNAGHFWLCPACAASLQRAHPTWGVFACARCGGVWADLEASLALRQVAEASIVSVGALASERAPGAERITAPEGRICPACRRRLAPVTFAGVSIDYCASHGTWFDRGEIECVVRAARAPAATNVTSLAPDQPDSSWVLEVVSDIVGGLVD